jgi:hypothetical protein
MHAVDRGTWGLKADDEGLHPVGEGVLWNESFYLDFAAEDGSIGGYVRLGLYPNWGRAWYWACVVGRDRPPALLADDLAPLPEEDLTVRGDGYRATQRTLSAMETVRLTLDADVAAGFSLDLEWRTAGGVYGYDLVPRYEVPCEVSGMIRVGDEQIPFTGYGERDHSWGERDWWKTSWLWSSGRLQDGTFLHGMQPNVDLALPWPSFEVPPGEPLAHCEGFAAATSFGEDGLPERADLSFGELPVTVTPIAFAPVTMVSPDNRVARFPRAMCRFEAGDGRIGYGWTEWHQPPGWRGHRWQGV